MRVSRYVDFCLIVLLINIAVFDRVDGYIFVVALECSEIFARFRELALFPAIDFIDFALSTFINLHALANEPMHEGTFAVEKIKLVVESSPRYKMI